MHSLALAGLGLGPGQLPVSHTSTGTLTLARWQGVTLAVPVPVEHQVQLELDLHVELEGASHRDGRLSDHGGGRFRVARWAGSSRHAGRPEPPGGRRCLCRRTVTAAPAGGGRSENPPAADGRLSKCPLGGGVPENARRAPPQTARRRPGGQHTKTSAGRRTTPPRAGERRLSTARPPDAGDVTAAVVLCTRHYRYAVLGARPASEVAKHSGWQYRTTYRYTTVTD